MTPAFEPRHGEAVEVAQGVRRVTAANAGPFTFQGTNSFLIGDDDIAVLDPGPDDPQHVENILRALGSAKLSAILVSHAHRDHASAAPLLQAETGAPIFASRPKRAARRAHGEQDPQMDAAADGQFAPDKMLVDGDVLAFGCTKLETIATPGHAADHLAFALMDQNILFSGDHVMGWATTAVAPPGGSMRDYMASLERLLARPESVYLPAHGGAIHDAHAYVRALRAHRKMRERGVLDRVAAGDGTVDAIAAQIYAQLDPRLRGAAALSTLAHLEDLVERGLVATQIGGGSSRRYWLTDAAESALGAAATGTAAGAAFGSG